MPVATLEITNFTMFWLGVPFAFVVATFSCNVIIIINRKYSYMKVVLSKYYAFDRVVPKVRDENFLV